MDDPVIAAMQPLWAISAKTNYDDGRSDFDCTHVARCHETKTSTSDSSHPATVCFIRLPVRTIVVYSHHTEGNSIPNILDHTTWLSFEGGVNQTSRYAFKWVCVSTTSIAQVLYEADIRMILRCRPGDS